MTVIDLRSDTVTQPNATFGQAVDIGVVTDVTCPACTQFIFIMNDNAAPQKQRLAFPGQEWKDKYASNKWHGASRKHVTEYLSKSHTFRKFEFTFLYKLIQKGNQNIAFNKLKSLTAKNMKNQAAPFRFANTDLL